MKTAFKKVCPSGIWLLVSKYPSPRKGTRIPGQRADYRAGQRKCKAILVHLVVSKDRVVLEAKEPKPRDRLISK